MRSVGTKDTRPEKAVRRLLTSMGFRYRLHRKDLPGSPDIVFPGRKKIIFVHGCFWHGHACKFGRLPKSNTAYWKKKLDDNRRRDRLAIRKLKRQGWKVLVIWSCEIKRTERLDLKISKFMNLEAKA